MKALTRHLPAGVVAALGLALLLHGSAATTAFADASLLSQGTAAFERGEFLEAVDIWESTDSREDALTRRYNAGVALLRLGKLDEALERFEDVSSRGDGELRERAESNLAYCHFQRGLAQVKAIDEKPPEAIDEHIEKLQAAAESYRSALEFYRRAQPLEDDDAHDADHDIDVTKTALVTLQDRIARLQDEKRRQDEEKALAEPAKLLLQLIQKEKLHRGVARELAQGDVPTSTRRVHTRRLRKAEFASRELTEKLLHRVERDLEEAKAKTTADPNGAPPTTAPPAGPPDLETLTESLIAATEEQLTALPDGPEKDATAAQLAQLRGLTTALPGMPDDQKFAIRDQIWGQLPDEAKRALTGQGAGGDAAVDTARLELAREKIATAVEAQKASEAAYGGHDLASAIASHGAAITALRDARLAFPLDVAQLVADGIATQEPLVRAARELDSQATLGLGRAAEDGPGDATQDEAKGGFAAFGRRLLDVAADKIVRPIAKVLTPSREAEFTVLGEEEDEVVWIAGILAQATIPASNGQPSAPGHAPMPPLGEDEARELTEKIQAEARSAGDAARRALEAFRGADAKSAMTPADEALAALRRIEELLPKPPKSPEEKLRELIERQHVAKEATDGLQPLAADALAEASPPLASSQRDDGSAAEEIAQELSAQRENPQAGQAAQKVTEGAGEVYASAEAIERSRPKDGGEAIDRAIAAFEEALRLLQGDQQQEEQQQESQSQTGPDSGGSKNSQGPQKQLTARQARMLRDEMDRKRREEEKKLFIGSSGVTVDKDW